VIDLPAQRIDYRAEAELVQSCAGIGQRDLAGQIIPVNISGPIDNPSIRPEIPTGLIQALRKRQPEQAPASPQPAPADTQPAPVEVIPGLVVPGQVLPGQRVQPGQREQQAQPAPQQPPPEQQQQPPPPQKPKEALRGILEGILKQR
jgi:hypothetical protein